MMVRCVLNNPLGVNDSTHRYLELPIGQFQLKKWMWKAFRNLKQVQMREWKLWDIADCLLRLYKNVNDEKEEKTKNKKGK